MVDVLRIWDWLVGQGVHDSSKRTEYCTVADINSNNYQFKSADAKKEEAPVYAS